MLNFKDFSLMEDKLILDNVITIYIPTKSKDKNITSKRFDIYRRAIISNFNNWFGGSTVSKDFGSWNDDDGITANEKVYRLYSYCNDVMMQH